MDKSSKEKGKITYLNRGPTWEGLYPRKTKNKHEKIEHDRKKHKSQRDREYEEKNGEYET